MYALSEALQTAINAGEPQRALIEFFLKPDGSTYGPEDGMPEPVRFSNEDILMTNGIQYTAEFNSETDLTIGLCPSAEIQFSMLNDREQLAEFEFGTFRAWLGARIAATGTESESPKRMQFPDGLYEFAPLGVFIARRPDVIKKDVIDVDANDRMTLFDEELPAGLISYNENTTVQTVVNAMCNHVGVTQNEIKVTDEWINRSIKVPAQPEKFDGATMREILGWAAEASCANARFDREGKLEFVWFKQTDRTFDEHDYTEFTPSWYETQKIDSLHIRNADETAEITLTIDEETGDIISGTGSNEYMIQDNPFLNAPESP